MGYLLDKAEKEGNFNKYRKYLLMRVFFDVLLFVAIIWSFYYTGSYYGEAVSICIHNCPCLNMSESSLPSMGAWTNESPNFTYNISGFVNGVRGNYGT